MAGEDDDFDDAMIPMRKFSEYQQEAWDTQAKKTAHSPQQSEAGFSLAPRRMGHSPMQSLSGMDQYASRPGSRAASAFNYPAGPAATFSPFGQSFAGSPAGSVVGSEFGAYRPPSMPFRASQMSFAGFPGAPGSNLGMPNPPYISPKSINVRNSTYSLAHWAGAHHGSSYSLTGSPFADPARSLPAVDPVNPTDAEILTALRNYLHTQDLLQITKASGVHHKSKATNRVCHPALDAGSHAATFRPSRSFDT